VTHDNEPVCRLLAEVHPSMRDDEARVEASACLQCGGPSAPAPCVSACPTSIDIPGFILQIAGGRPTEAAEIIFRSNILGGTCGRVCPVEELCQGSCVLLKSGRRAIQIGRLQRHACDALEAVECTVSVKPRKRTGREVAVVGAGPAGLACAAELARLNYRVTVYERRPMAGGLVVHGIAPYKQLVDPIPAEVERIRRLGVEFRFDVKVGRDITAAQLRERYLAVFLGIGMGPDTPAKLPGEHLIGVWDSLEFIERVKTANLTSFHMGQRIVVIGGGNTAVDVAREAARLGCMDVTMVYRRDEAQMPAYRHEVVAAKAEGVKLVCLTAPLEFVGSERVVGVRCVKMRLGEPDSSGRSRPEQVPGSEFMLPSDMVVKAIGQRPLLDLIGGFGVEAPGGNVRVDGEGHTSEAWCYAGGDCINGGATVVEAVRDGKRAAQSIHRSLAKLPAAKQKEPLAAMIVHRGPVISHMQGLSELATSPGLCKGCRLCVESCPSEILNLDDQSKIVVSDVNRCVFCGICEDRCPDFAIWLNKGPTAREESELLA
jgi:dihydropyrimidine dehydrogenase (NAD+) subunit PreT